MCSDFLQLWLSGSRIPYSGTRRAESKRNLLSTNMYMDSTKHGFYDQSHRTPKSQSVKTDNTGQLN